VNLFIFGSSSQAQDYRTCHISSGVPTGISVGGLEGVTVVNITSGVILHYWSAGLKT
jgi:hypothetical protein